MSFTGKYWIKVRIRVRQKVRVSVIIGYGVVPIFRVTILPFLSELWVINSEF